MGVIVAHRISTITSCDQILFLEKSSVGKGARLAEAGSHEDLMAKNGKYAAFVSHLHQQAGEQVAVESRSLGGANSSSVARTASALQIQLKETSMRLQTEFFNDGAETVTAVAPTVRPVPMAFLQTVSELKHTLQQIEDASAVRLLVDGGLPMTLSKSSSSQPGSLPGTPRADGGLGGIAGTDYESPR